MLRNYLTAALRNLVRNKFYTALNMLGLAVGFAAAILIGLYVRDELTFDRWLPDRERTYLLTVEMANENHQPIYSDLVPSELVAPLKQEFPEVEDAARVMWGGASMRHGDIEEYEQLFTVDPAFLDVVKLPIVAGDLHEALRRPDGLVLTRRLARKYFGRDDPVGETIELDRQHTVTLAAVVEDLPSNSTVSFGGLVSGLASYSMLAQRDADPHASEAGNFFTDSETYIRLRSGASAERVKAGLAAFLQRQKGPWLAQGGVRATLNLTPITDIHLSKGTRGFHLDVLPRGDIATIGGILAVGVLIVLVACINFINLMTARSIRRAVEVGVRKTSGAFRRDLIAQFLSEALIYAGFAMALAMAVVSLVLPSFNALLDKTLVFAFWRDGPLAGVLAGVTLASALLAGFYPALVLSAFRPAAVLKAPLQAGTISTAGRQLLAGLQFAILIVLIVGTGVVYRQTRFAFHEGMRLDLDQMVMMNANCRSDFKDRVAALPGVKGVACLTFTALGYPGLVNNATGPEGREVGVQNNAVDFGFFELWGLKPAAGRFFSQDHADAVATDPTAPMQGSVVINETALLAFGFKNAQDAIGKAITVRGFRDSAKPSEIIGVVPDFALDSVHEAVVPSVYYVSAPEFNYLSAKLTGREIPETLDAIQRIWARGSDNWLLRFTFQTTVLDREFTDITRQGQMLTAFASIALFVACLGLIGLSVVTAERRTKEIGVRKALGATKRDIFGLLLREFATPVLWANLIAWPVAYVVMRRWLQGFAYHVGLEPWTFLAATALALLIALATVAGHAILVARAQPAMALRYE